MLTQGKLHPTTVSDAIKPLAAVDRSHQSHANKARVCSVLCPPRRHLCRSPSSFTVEERTAPCVADPPCHCAELVNVSPTGKEEVDVRAGNAAACVGPDVVTFDAEHDLPQLDIVA